MKQQETRQYKLSIQYTPQYTDTHTNTPLHLSRTQTASGGTDGTAEARLEGDVANKRNMGSVQWLQKNGVMKQVLTEAGGYSLLSSPPKGKQGRRVSLAIWVLTVSFKPFKAVSIIGTTGCSLHYFTNYLEFNLKTW